MNLTLKQLLDCVMGRNIPSEFANENIDYEAALRDEIKKLAGTYSLYRRNKYEIFDFKNHRPLSEFGGRRIFV